MNFIFSYMSKLSQQEERDYDECESFNVCNFILLSEV